LTASIWPGLIILSGIAALLALLLEIARGVIADYPDVALTINRKKTLTVKGGAPLLSTLQDQGIFLPSACGGRGTCALCKARIEEGGGPVLPTETPYLTEEEIRDGIRLSCQIKVRGDLKIEIPEELFQVQEYRTRTERISTLTPFIKAFRFHVLEPEEGVSFLPGQYIQLQIPAGKSSQAPPYRAYSIASSASEPRHIDIIVARIDKGEVSTYLHERLREGMELTMRGPFGDFYLREGDRDLLFVATGSGLAPILAILRHMAESGIRRRTTLYFGNRRPDDLFGMEELRDLGKSLPGFHFVPVLSRIPPGTTWTGERGRVTDLIQKNITRNAPLDVYICGSSGMVEDSRSRLLEKGIPSERIFFDRFD